MPTSRVNGIDVYYERAGSGRRLLFLNGSGATLERISPLLAVLHQRFDVVAHDQRGLGRTERPAGPYSMADYAADAAGLLDEVGWDRCAVLGVSFGGMVAQELAVTWPDRVERLVLACTSPGGDDLASYPLHELAAMPEGVRTELGARLLDTRFTPEWLAEHPNDRALAEGMGERTGARGSDDEQRGRDEQLRARRYHDVVDRLGAITAPTLVACGRYDGIAPVANGQAIAERVRGAVLRVYEGGHIFFVQDPEALPDIMAFLDGATLVPRP